MEDYVRRQKIQTLLDLRGKVQIEYDWEQEENSVLHAFQAIKHLEMSASLWVTAGRLSAQLRSNG